MKNTIVAMALILGLASCGQFDPKIQELESRVAELERRVKELETDIELLKVSNKKGVTPGPKKSQKSIAPAKQSISSPRIKKESSTGYSGQCQATTKKGYQCSRRARSGGYCWQHGG